MYAHELVSKVIKVARNYSYVASTTAINNAAASHKINYALSKKRLATGL